MGYNNVYIISIKRFLSLTLEPVKEGSMQKFKEHKLGVAIIFSLMFLTPFMENTRGIFIPIFKDDFGVSNTAISSMITIVSLLGMGVTLIGGAVIEKIGQKKTIIIGIVHLIVGIVIQSQAKTFPVFFLGLFPIIAGINFYNVAANTIVPLIFVGSSAIAMNLLHFYVRSRIHRISKCSRVFTRSKNHMENHVSVCGTVLCHSSGGIYYG